MMKKKFLIEILIQEIIANDDAWLSGELLRPYAQVQSRTYKISHGEFVLPFPPQKVESPRNTEFDSAPIYTRALSCISWGESSLDFKTSYSQEQQLGYL